VGRSSEKNAKIFIPQTEREELVKSLLANSPRNRASFIESAAIPVAEKMVARVTFGRGRGIHRDDYGLIEDIGKEGDDWYALLAQPYFGKKISCQCKIITGTRTGRCLLDQKKGRIYFYGFNEESSADVICGK
jgi:hypothetical protein